MRTPKALEQGHQADDLLRQPAVAQQQREIALVHQPEVPVAARLEWRRGNRTTRPVLLNVPQEFFGDMEPDLPTPVKMSFRPSVTAPDTARAVATNSGPRCRGGGGPGASVSMRMRGAGRGRGRFSG